MSIKWTRGERKVIDAGIATHGIQSKRCAALARIVHRVALKKDPNASAVRMRPPKGAMWLEPKAFGIPYWNEHVYVDTRGHAVDAITGACGYEPSKTYVLEHWEDAELMRIETVDPATIDPGIQDADKET